MGCNNLKLDLKYYDCQIKLKVLKVNINKRTKSQNGRFCKKIKRYGNYEWDNKVWVKYSTNAWKMATKISRKGQIMTMG